MRMDVTTAWLWAWKGGGPWGIQQSRGKGGPGGGKGLVCWGERREHERHRQGYSDTKLRRRCVPGSREPLQVVEGVQWHGWAGGGRGTS